MSTVFGRAGRRAAGVGQPPRGARKLRPNGTVAISNARDDGTSVSAVQRSRRDSRRRSGRRRCSSSRSSSPASFNEFQLGHTDNPIVGGAGTRRCRSVTVTVGAATLTAGPEVGAQASGSNGDVDRDRRLRRAATRAESHARRSAPTSSSSGTTSRHQNRLRPMGVPEPRRARGGAASRSRSARISAAREAPVAGAEPSVYASDEWRVSDRLSLTLGLRADGLAFSRHPRVQPGRRFAVSSSNERLSALSPAVVAEGRVRVAAGRRAPHERSRRRRRVRRPAAAGLARRGRCARTEPASDAVVRRWKCARVHAVSGPAAGDVRRRIRPRRMAPVTLVDRNLRMARDDPRVARRRPATAMEHDRRASRRLYSQSAIRLRFLQSRS